MALCTRGDVGAVFVGHGPMMTASWDSRRDSAACEAARCSDAFNTSGASRSCGSGWDVG